MSDAKSTIIPARHGAALRAGCIAAAGTLGILAGTGAVSAQEEELGASPPIRIYDMPRPAYERPGIKQYGFLLHADASETTSYDDNILASSSRILSDFVSETNELMSAESLWSKHSLSAHVFGIQQIYANHGTENAYQFGGDASGRLDIARDVYAEIDVAAAQLAQARSTPQLDVSAVGRPVYNNYTGTAFAYGKRQKWFDRGGVTVHQTAYVSDLSAQGSGTQFIYFNRVGREFSDFFNVYADASYAQHEWLIRPEFRNFDLLTMLIGSQFQIPDVLDITVSVGALRQSYRYSAFDTLVSPTFNVQLLWNVTPLTSVYLTGENQVVGTENFCGGTLRFCGPGSLRADQRNTLEVTRALVGVQHEIWHNLLMDVRFRYERDVFDFTGLIDNNFSARLNAHYFINRHWEADLDYAHNRRTANQPDNRTFNTGPFHENVVSFTLKARL